MSAQSISQIGKRAQARVGPTRRVARLTPPAKGE
jgi:hypothetical protein